MGIHVHVARTSTYMVIVTTGVRVLKEGDYVVSKLIFTDHNNVDSVT